MKFWRSSCTLFLSYFFQIVVDFSIVQEMKYFFPFQLQMAHTHVHPNSWFNRETKKNVLELIRSSNCVAWPPVFDLAPKLAATMIVNALFFFLQLQNLVNTELFLLCNVFIKLISFLVKNDERRIVVWSVNVFKFHWPKNMNKCHGHEMGQKKKNS